MTLVVREDRPGRPEILALLERHLEHSRASSPPESCHALDLRGLDDPRVTFYAAWEDETLLGVGALMELDRNSGEVKSMHTAEAARGRGIARTLLSHIVAVAEQRGYRSLALETGSMAAYDAARQLYLKHGFRPCPPFGDYRPDPNSVFMTLALPCTTARQNPSSSASSRR